MNYYTFTSWDQVEAWIRNNGLVRWAFAAERDKEGKLSRYVANSEWYPGDFDEQLATTRKALEQQPGRYLYGSGFHTDNKTMGEATCDVMLSAAGISGLPMQQQQQQQPIDIAGMENRIRKQVIAEIEAERYKQERAQYEKERKEWEKEKAGAIGLVIQYAQPIIAALKERGGLRQVAGFADSKHPVTVAPIEPLEPAADPEPEIHNPEPTPQDPDEQTPFSDAEAETLFKLMARFKAVEPDYIKLLAAVVEMAEQGDTMYKTAKGLLMK